MQVVVPPRLAEELRVLLATSHLVAVAGRVERSGQQTGQQKEWGQHVTVLAHALRALPPVTHLQQAEQGEAAPEREVLAGEHADGGDEMVAAS